MEYLLKASAVITIFYLCYKLFLQRDTFFEFNRVFLLLGIITGFLIPFVVIPIYVEYSPIDLSNFTTNTYTLTETIEEHFNLVDLIPIIYIMGVIGFSIRFIIQLVSLSRVILKNKRDKQSHFTIITTTNNILPFSYFKWIVFNPALFNKEELKQIIAHEMVHVKQYHSIDNIVTQLACIVLWFNPFIWLYNKDLKQNLEFIADQNAQQKTDCKKSYQYTLLKTSMPTHQLALTNNFYNSLIKKRIIMLHKSKSKKINQIKYALVIPLLAVFLMSFNTEEVYVNSESKTNPTIANSQTETEEFIISGSVSLEGIGSKLKGVYLSIEKKQRGVLTNSNGEFKIKSAIGDKIIISKKGLHSKEITIKNKDYLNIILGTVSGLIIDAMNPKKPIYYIHGKKVSKKVYNRISDSIMKTAFTKKSNNNNNNKSQSIVSGIVTDIKGNPIEKVMIINGTNSGVMTNNKGEYKIKSQKGDELIFTFEGMATQKIKVENKTQLNIQLQPENKKSKTSTWKVRFGVNANEENNKVPLILLDGKEISNEEFEKIDPKSIKSIDVLKDEKAEKIYGEKGKNGVLIITTKEKTTGVTVIGYGKPSDSNKNTGILTGIDCRSTLIILDGKEIEKKELEDIHDTDVESVNIFRNEEAIEKYGKKGENGVIVITTKGKASEVLVTGYGKSSDSINDSQSIRIRATSTANGKQPLVIVDGKELPYEKLEKIKPDNIKSIDVLKDEKAIEKYGKKGKNGVVEITTKK
ncbi:M56 family metallopeptidase [Thalassobellus sediminis]|uniref:M56 family metallopeptidase n=1 Tax=Thalassobellus sediminis TaxID=3367753 RepID=UPI003795DF9C